MSRFLPTLMGGKAEFHLSFLLAPSLSEHLSVLKRHRNFLVFNAQNPTGHYNLDLSNPGDHSVATDILLIDRWESAVHKKLKRVDFSQRGNHSHIRNESFSDIALSHLSSIAEWTLPESGNLKLDYASSKRPPKDAAVLDDETFTEVLLTLYKAGAEESTRLSDEHQLNALRVVSHMLYVKSIQLREILGNYKHESTRGDIYVMMIMQLVDMHNEKLFRVRFAERESLDRVRHRLGQAVCFPFVQPEQTWFDFNFAVYEDRFAANILMSYANKEGFDNLVEVTYTHADGTVDPLPLGVPRTWVLWNQMPKSGRFTGRYLCGPEERRYEMRAQAQKHYGLWSAAAKDADVMWWAVLTETPPDVLEYMEFIVAKFPSTKKAFAAIDGLGGKGQISLREFENATLDPEEKGGMGCQKFKGEDARQRLAAIFRYMDNSGEGQVSESEWLILDLLFREIKLSIKEFVNFLVRTFGDIEDSWEAFDESGDGEIDKQEWVELLTKLGYFGPARPIFSYLDKDDGGSISLEEFMALEDFVDAESRPESRESEEP